MKLYKIQDKQTGLFSNGGTYPNWTKIGKVWKQMGHLKNHLNLIRNYGPRDFYGKDIKVIEIEYTEENIKEINIDEI